MSCEKVWHAIACSRRELRLDLTLACGQSFRWRELHPGHWTSVLADHVWTLKQTDDTLYYRIETGDDGGKPPPVLVPSGDVKPGSLVHSGDVKPGSLVHSGDVKPGSLVHRGDVTLKPQPPRDEDVKPVLVQNGDVKPVATLLHSCDIKPAIKCSPNIEGEFTKHDHTYYDAILTDYFQLGVDLDQLYHQWSSVDPNFKQKAQDFTGIRILRQDPIENLFSFICSSNNNISRISLMVQKMCEKFGRKIQEFDGTAYHSFPTIEALSGRNVEQSLRTLGFGYRAKYISESAKYLQKNHSSEWVFGLRERPYEEAKAELIKLCGVGAKVADCVCLMSLDKHGSIPVDTHVWQIVTRDYKQAGLSSTKSVTNTVYRQVGDFFRELWGEYAGWAHSVLFSADLKKFQDNRSSPKKRQPGNSKNVPKVEVAQKKAKKK